jgi:CheY-like chemotaxis protein
VKRQNQTLLLVEDDTNDQILLCRALRDSGIQHSIQTACSGAEAVAYLNGEGKYADRRHFGFPSCIISDLKMPMGDGFMVLHHLKHHAEWCVIPCILLSSSCDPHDVATAYSLGASSYFQKPSSLSELTVLMKKIHEYWRLAEVPLVDAHGKRIPGQSTGKFGERFEFRSR